MACTAVGVRRGGDAEEERAADEQGSWELAATCCLELVRRHDKHLAAAAALDACGSWWRRGVARSIWFRPGQPELAHVALVAERVAALVAACEDRRGWLVAKETAHCTTLLRDKDYEHARPLPPSELQFQICGKLDTALFPLLALLFEVDLWPSWIPTILGLGITRVTRFDEPSEQFPATLKFGICVKLPWPFANRVVLVRAQGVDAMHSVDAGVAARLARRAGSAGRAEDAAGVRAAVDDLVRMLLAHDRVVAEEAAEGAAARRVFVLLETLEPETAPEREFAALGTPVRLEESGVVIQPVAGGGSEFRCACRIDPGLGDLSPYVWLIELCLKQFAFLIVAQIRNAHKLVMDPRGPWVQRIRTATGGVRAFYERIARRVEESLPGERGSIIR